MHRSHAAVVLLLAGSLTAVVPTQAKAQTTVAVGTGETITEADLAAGGFAGQSFTLGSDTTFAINNGGTIGPAGDFPDGFDFAGSHVHINAGGLFASTDPDPSAPFVQSNVTNINLDIYDGGTIGENFFVLGASTVNIHGGTTRGNMALFSGAVANVSGGTIGDLFTAFTGATINISGGTIMNDVVAADFSSLNITGGTFGSYITTFDGSVTNIKGGSIGEEFVAFEGAEVNLAVTSLMIDGVAVDLSLGDSLLIDQRGGVLLEATLADGSYLDFTLNGDFVSGEDVFEYGTRLTATMVPAPSATALLGLGGLVAGRRRRS